MGLVVLWCGVVCDDDAELPIHGGGIEREGDLFVRSNREEHW